MKTNPDGAPLFTGRGLQQVKERVAQEFDKARNSGATSFVPAKPVQKPVMTTENCIAHPQVRLTTEPKLQPSLQQRAEILAKTVPTSGSIAYRRRNVAECWDIGDAPVVVNVNKLFDAALTALGYAPEKPPMDLLRTCLSAEPKRLSIWKRDIFRRTR